MLLRCESCLVHPKTRGPANNPKEEIRTPRTPTVGLDSCCLGCFGVFNAQIVVDFPLILYSARRHSGGADCVEDYGWRGR